MHEPSLAQQILSCCDKILFSHTQRGYHYFFLIISLFFGFFFLLFYVIINFQKNYFIIIIIFFFFHENYFIFSCSGMFRNVPCSWFYRRPISATILARGKSAGRNMIGLNQQRKSQASSRSFGGMRAGSFSQQRLVIEPMCNVGSRVSDVQCIISVVAFRAMLFELRLFGFILQLIVKVTYL